MTGRADVSLSELARTPIPLDARAYGIRDAAGTIRGVPHRWRWTVEGLEDLPGAALVALDAIADVLRAAGGIGDDLWALADSVQAKLRELAAIHGPDHLLVATIGEHHPLSIATEECDRLLSAAGRVVAAETGRREVGALVGIQRSDGGAPKSPAVSAEIGPGGLVGDRQATREHHGRPFQAVSLYSADVIGSLAAEGHPISAGSVGENLTLSGLDWGALRPGFRLALGDREPVVLEITSWAPPCSTIAGSFSNRRFDRIDHDKHPGWSRAYACVIRSGGVVAGDRVAVLP